MNAELDGERRAWELLTRDFPWSPSVHGALEPYRDAGSSGDRTRFQLFEVAVATVFAATKPDYKWYVSPNHADGGLDFLGEQQLLKDEQLGIDAVITIGGQCKKRSGRVGSLVDEIAGSLANMSAIANPTLFVVVFSARLSPERVEKAREILERAYNRHCHILDRRQIEGMIHANLEVLDSLFDEALSGSEKEEVIAHLSTAQADREPISLEVKTRRRVLAGEPLQVTIGTDATLARTDALRLHWRPVSTDRVSRCAKLVGPIAAEEATGTGLATIPGDPIRGEQVLELASHALGRVRLGEVRVEAPDDAVSSEWVDLGEVLVIDNIRPRFFEQPVRRGIVRLTEEYERARASGLATIGVTGAGGSGKSRLCQEFALERRRRGCDIVSARPAKTLDDPYALFADLFTKLAAEGVSGDSRASRVIAAIASVDRDLSKRAAPALRSVFGVTQKRSEEVREHDIVAALRVLIAARNRDAPLIVHLQDLHWCSSEILQTLERLTVELDRTLAGPAPGRDDPDDGVLFLLEGRVREQGRAGDGEWSTGPFEAFLRKLDCRTVVCGPFTPADGLKFIERLFEDGESEAQLLNLDLLELQRALIDRIDRTSGGNPFHSLEQVQLLKEQRVLGQNRETGLLYLIQPPPERFSLPDSVFESIRLRWEYLRERNPEIALLLWGTALLDDRVPTPLFRRLWRELAPDAALTDIDATDLLWTDEGEDDRVAFRHENYFHSIRRFEVSGPDRERVVAVYANWFAGARARAPSDLLKWAHALRELPEPDLEQARGLLRTAVVEARRRGEMSLERRIRAAALDLDWDEDSRSSMDAAAFLGLCDAELELIRALIESDRFQADRRLRVLLERVGRRHDMMRSHSESDLIELSLRRLSAEVLRAQILFNDEQSVRAADVAAQALHDVQASRVSGIGLDATAWRELEMEALHAQAAALALSGDVEAALETSAQAVTLARHSSSELSRHVVSTYANLLLAKDAAESERILRGLLADSASEADRDSIEVNLSMALVLRADRLGQGEPGRAQAMLDEARGLLKRAFSHAFQLGNRPGAGAAALMLGIVSALTEDGDEVSWFAQAVTASLSGRQRETLWRAHINLATALFRAKGEVDGAVRDHAEAALEIMEATLSPYAQPDRSLRFALIRVPFAQAVRFLLIVGDEAGTAALERHPGLREVFASVEAGTLREDRGGHSSHEWLRVGDDDYVIY